MFQKKFHDKFGEFGVFTDWNDPPERRGGYEDSDEDYPTRERWRYGEIDYSM